MNSIAFLSPLLFLLSFGNLGLAPIAWVAFAPYLYSIAKSKTSLLTSYLIGYIFFAGGMYWLYHISILATFAAALVFALYFVISHALYIAGGQRLYLFPFIWLLVEWCQELLPVAGVPWLCLSYTQADTAFVQVSDILGAKFVSFMIVMFSCIIVDCLINGVQKRTRTVLASFLIVYLMGIIYGFIVQNSLELKKGDSALIVQGRLQQEVKEELLIKIRDQAGKVVDMYDELTAEAISPEVSLIIWPETTFIGRSGLAFCRKCESFHALSDYYNAGEVLSALYKKYRVPIVSGCEMISLDHSNFKVDDIKIYNSIVFYDGTAISEYSKRTLVPFGEYIPFVEMFPFILDIVKKTTKLSGLGSFTPGESIRIFKTKHASYGALVCYEGIFPQLISEYKRSGSNVVINCSNEAWFKESLELDQMTAISKVRAIENRTTIVRATNSGISAVIDPLGRAEVLTDQSGNSKYVRGTLTKQISYTDYIPFFVLHGDMLPLLAAFLVLVFIVITKQWTHTYVAGYYR